MIERKTVTSSNIAAVGYDADTRTLVLEFRPDRNGNRAVWQYDDVAPWIYQEMMEGSVGITVGTHVRGRHAERKIAVIDSDNVEHEIPAPVNTP